ncbi:hypothetical protein ACFOKJ_12005 [Vogesella amnigena]|uniref:Uncharacterized protein n=1 Tax=Vogesella amnigena TaxID=1507449 RepID=A0ABV7TVQ6_9NEIS
MINRDSITHDLLDRDGSCRDINFGERINKTGATGIIDFLASEWTLTQAMSGDGEELALLALPKFFDRAPGTLSTIWHGNKDPNYLQVFFSWSVPAEIFCELTFFPEHLNETQFMLEDFLAFVSKLVCASGSSEYYVRYENASWRHGDVKTNAGVIFSHENFMLPNS